MFVEIEGIESPLEVVFNAERRTVAKGETRNVNVCHIYNGEGVCIGSGEAVQNPADEYNHETGQRIAMKRAFRHCVFFKRYLCGVEWYRQSWSRFRYAYRCNQIDKCPYSFSQGGKVYNLPIFPSEEEMPF